jgi:hypothetical protein
MEATIVEWLQQHAREHRLKERALECCTQYLQNYHEENPEEWVAIMGDSTLEGLRRVWTKHYLVFEDGERHWTRILTQIQIGEPSEHALHI